MKETTFTITMRGDAFLTPIFDPIWNLGQKAKEYGFDTTIKCRHGSSVSEPEPSVFDQYTLEDKEISEFERDFPRMWNVGDVVTQKDGRKVLIIEMANPDTPYETVGAIGDSSRFEDQIAVVHRYNRGDYGRVTGTNGRDQRDFVVKT